MGHGNWILCGIEFQPGILGILLQQAQPLQATTYSLTNRLDQILQFVFNRRFDALESRGPVVADVNTIQKQERPRFNKCVKLRNQSI